MFTIPEFKWLEIDQIAPLQEAKSAAIAAGKRVFDLSMINPDLAPARLLLDRLLEATTKPRNHRYAVARGIRKLREGFACKYRNRFGVELDPEQQICVTMGAKDALINLLWCLTHGKDRVVIGKPTYPAYLSALRLSKIEPLFFEIGPDAKEMVAQIKALVSGKEPPAGIILNFPNNPTGVIVDRDFYQEIYSIVAGTDLFVINDFVYGELTWGAEEPASLLSVPQFNGSNSCAVEIYSMSKAYNVPGWRVAAVVGNQEVCRLLAKLKAHVDYGLFLPLQLAAAAALSSHQDITTTVAEQYRRRADVLSQGISALGWEVVIPQAGAFLWAKLPKEHNDLNSLDFCCELARQTGIFLLPGEVFGSDYRNCVRLALVLPEESLREVLAGLNSYRGCP